MTATKKTAKASAPKKAASAKKAKTAKKAQPAAESATPAGETQVSKTKAVREAKPKAMSALDAAAKVLAEAGTAMNCKEMIEAMAAKGYWTSPGGKTPAQTLYAAILRETQAKGKDARFAKAERGQFALNGAA